VDLADRTLYVGYEWLVAGWISSSTLPGDTKQVLLYQAINTISLITSTHPLSVMVCGLFKLSSHRLGFWSYVVAFGETSLSLAVWVFLPGLPLSLAFMNMNYMLAGSISTNPILLFLSIFLILAWKTAGWWGLDRWVLIDLGTPWSPGLAFQPKSADKQPAPTTEMKGSH
jgi:thiosulfate dehydrogenase [quinone] large subunit